MDVSSKWDAYCDELDRWADKIRKECNKRGYVINTDDYSIELEDSYNRCLRGEETFKQSVNCLIKRLKLNSEHNP